MLSARTVGSEELDPEFDHMALLIRPEERRWLVDVAVSETSSQNQKHLDMDGPQMEDGKAFRIAPVEGGRIALEVGRGEGFVEARISVQADTEKAGGFCRQVYLSPRQPRLLLQEGGFCSILTPAGRLTVTEKKLIVTRAGRRSERPVRDKKGFPTALLRRRFGIDLDRTTLAS